MVFRPWRLFRDKRGNAGIVFALVATPLLGLVGVAVDYSNAVSIRSAMQHAVDVSALAAVKGFAPSAAMRQQTAKAVFQANLTRDRLSENAVTPSVRVNSAGDRVTVSAATTEISTLAQLIGIHDTEIAATATAVRNAGYSVCVLALNTSMPESISFSGDAELVGDNCAVHSNSDASNAIRASGAANVSALSFSSRGGHSGGSRFTPPPLDYQSTIDDPYASLAPPAAGPCDHLNTRITNDTVVLGPGVYCGGLVFASHANVTLTPGVYVIRDGPLEIRSQSTVTGPGVTFYLTGTDAGVELRSGASVTVSAPVAGPYAGLAFFQDPASNPGHDNDIRGGASIEVVGTWYFPTQGLTVTGAGSFGVASPVVAMIADHLAFKGNGRIFARTDNLAANLPDVRPSVLDDIRLIE